MRNYDVVKGILIFLQVTLMLAENLQVYHTTLFCRGKFCVVCVTGVWLLQKWLTDINSLTEIIC